MVTSVKAIQLPQCRHASQSCGHRGRHQLLSKKKVGVACISNRTCDPINSRTNPTRVFQLVAWEQRPVVRVVARSPLWFDKVPLRTPRRLSRRVRISLRRPRLAAVSLTLSGFRLYTFWHKNWRCCFVVRRDVVCVRLKWYFGKVVFDYFNLNKDYLINAPLAPRTAVTQSASGTIRHTAHAYNRVVNYNGAPFGTKVPRGVFRL